uniref:Uncharacterized protein n=1 Tax=Panagrolaimus sp. PS1159 TaxID=55785 RepID=A0AC35G3P5_9BILA
MRKHRRFMENSPGPLSSSSSQRVTFDSSMPSMSSSNFHRAFDAETAALRALKNRRTSLPVNTHTETTPSLFH